jgi:hypothetical protein
MVNATVDNAPVSIQLNGTSTTVPSNETWVVHITAHGGQATSQLKINGVGRTVSSGNSSDPHPPQFKMVLTGGDTIEELSGKLGSMVSIQGFVVDS